MISDDIKLIRGQHEMTQNNIQQHWHLLLLLRQQVVETPPNDLVEKGRWDTETKWQFSQTLRSTS